MITAPPKGIVLKLTFYKTAEYDHKELGAGYKVDGTEDYSRWDMDIRDLNGVIWASEITDIQDRLRQHLQDYGLNLEDFVIFDNGRLTAAFDEDENGNAVDGSTFSSFRGQLYLVDYDIYITALPDEYPLTINEMKALFPSLKEYWE